MVAIQERIWSPECAQSLQQAGVHPVLARIFAARGIACADEIDHRMEHLIAFHHLKGAAEAATFLADAIENRARFLVIADYDSDGATACAVAVRALRSMGATADYLVPNRFEYGYGLTPEIVRLAAQRHPDILITVDNGIANIDGVREANALGMQVVVTDHHLPGDSLPAAACIVNPNQPGCPFPSKNLAGVGVIFYVMSALRAELRRRDFFQARPEPKLADLLDLVALGTVADVVRLDRNNRVLVHHGLARIRAGRCHPGIAALFRVSGRDARKATVYDLAFMLGPRLNAAGRLDDMSLGIACLLCEDEPAALRLAGELDALNRERREIELNMKETALASLAEIQVQDRFSLSVFREDWHQGVIGILASRLKDQYHRPVIAFAPGQPGELKGSGRSIPGFHLRDALDLVWKRRPDLILKFGGHAAAAGLTIREADFASFRDEFERVACALLSPSDLQKCLDTDGELDATMISLDLALLLDAQVWGQGFPPPLFRGSFSVREQRIVGGKHTRARLARGGGDFEAMLFNANAELPADIEIVYRLGINDYNGKRILQLIIDHWNPA